MGLGFRDGDGDEDGNGAEVGEMDWEKDAGP